MNKALVGVVFLGALILVAIGAMAINRTPATVQDNSPAQNTAGSVIPSGNLSGTVTSGENPRPGDSVHNLPVEPAAAKARTVLAARLGASEGSIVILSVEPASWPNACLGLPQPGEMCAEVITPGFKVSMTVNGSTYVYRTNQTGTVVRAEN